MPCYCDEPDSSDQATIEERCKVNMYFDAQVLMTEEQIQKASEQGIGKFPVGDVNEKLCKLCSLLTKEQMEKVRAYYYQIEWKHKTLYDWYQQHLIDDEIYKKDAPLRAKRDAELKESFLERAEKLEKNYKRHY